jgi:hypothetical protein
VIARWREWYLRREPRAGDVAWDEERLEYRFAVSVGGASPKELPVVELAAPEHDGTHLDWYTFDVARDASDATSGRTRVLTAIPAPVTYQGMPASRWWQFEDGTVNFGDLDAGPGDLARLLVAEFATVYGDDWFVVPVAVPVGSITEIGGIEILDNFNHRTTIASTALNDERRTGGRRVWRAFELAGDAVSKDHPSPWMFVPPTLASQVDGPLLEHVILARDEGANLAWAIERIVEGPLGRGIDRGEAWHAAAAGVPVPNKQATAARTPFAYDEQWWRYRLELPTPPWWIPFVPERVTQEGAEVRLRRARMHSWEPLAAGPAAAAVGPQGMLLDPRRPCWLYEEEVPRSGVRIERRWQFARWHDGSFHVWLQRRKLAGKGERSSGIRWDMLERGVQPL